MAAGDGLLTERVKLVSELRQAGIKVHYSGPSELSVTHLFTFHLDRFLSKDKTEAPYPV